MEARKTQIIYEEKNTVEVKVDDNDRKKRALNDTEISELIKSGLKIEKHYKMPMDIEWAIKDDEVYILQAKAITTLKSSINHISKDNLVQKYTKGKKINRSTQEVMEYSSLKARG